MSSDPASVLVISPDHKSEWVQQFFSQKPLALLAEKQVFLSELPDTLPQSIKVVIFFQEDTRASKIMLFGKSTVQLIMLYNPISGTPTLALRQNGVYDCLPEEEITAVWLHHVIINALLYADTHVSKTETQELEKKNQRLRDMDRLKSKFVSDITHELRTPITALGLHLDLLQFSDGEKQDIYLKTIRREVERMTELLSDVMTLTRFDLGYVETKWSQLAFNLLVSDSVASQMFKAREQNLSLDFIADDLIPPMIGDENLLSEMVQFLIDNGLKYTEEGGVLVETHYEKEFDCIRLEITDTGRGIDPAEQTHIFERFYRGKSSQSIPGTGLGLTIIKEIITLHSGEISLTSTVGQGTRFVVRLPVDTTNPLVALSS